MVDLSKSNYCRGVQCPKMLWLDINNRDVVEQKMDQACLDTGNEVGDLAMGFFGKFVEVPFNKKKPERITETKRLLDAGEKTICKATFGYEDNFCSVDILRVHDDGVDIVEVKSSTNVKDIYLDDMAYQLYVLTGCGINVKGVYNLHINNEYVRQGELDLQQLFTLVDCTEVCKNRQAAIPSMLQTIYDCLKQKGEPTKELSMNCMEPYECPYWPHCSKHLPSPNVFDVRRLKKETKFEYNAKSISSFEDLLEKVKTKEAKLNEKQLRQVKTEVEGLEPYMDKAAIKEFLDTLTYPLYFLDFETFQQAIPQFDGIRPYMQIPFQYSLHVLSSQDAELKHYEFLGKEGTDPIRALAEQMVCDIPKDVCTLAYNMTFEKTVIKNLAEQYPDLHDHLMNIHDNIKDLMVPFSKGAYYCKEMKGSYSIKYVLPAICPGDPELEYGNLEGIHNGSEAMNAFAELAKKSPKEVVAIRKQLLAYCRLDTLAMVKILEKLWGVVEEFD